MIELSRPWEQPWPAQDLEAVSRCPVCGGDAAEVWHAALVDDAFRVAPGRWCMRRCQSCGSGFLDPRPTVGAIGRAYQSYYTHRVAEGDPGVAVGLARLRHRLAAGFLRQRFGLVDNEASAWGPLVAACAPGRRGILEYHMRHLPRLPPGGGRVLDLGCGGGEFLLRARACGWQVTGVEPDPTAAERCRRAGLDVLVGGIDSLEGEASVFDVITGSHVIEHVHMPGAVLQACWRLLKPGGRLWLQTPNANSIGHAVFGPHWRGLEAPRHLVIFTAGSLTGAVQAAGFEDVSCHAGPGALRWIARRSFAIAAGMPPETERPLSWFAMLHIVREKLRGRSPGLRSEFVTLMARRPLR